MTKKEMKQKIIEKYWLKPLMPSKDLLEGADEIIKFYKKKIDELVDAPEGEEKKIEGMYLLEKIDNDKFLYYSVFEKIWRFYWNEVPADENAFRDLMLKKMILPMWKQFGELQKQQRFVIENCLPEEVSLLFSDF